MIVVAFGCNLGSSEREKILRFCAARESLIAAGCRLAGQSALFLTPPLGSGHQPAYLNAIAVFDRGPPPAMLLRLLKRIERIHGRRFGRHWGPRVLDLDLILHGSRVTGWPVHRRHRGALSVPHPELHRRAFVLLPMLDAERSIGRAFWHPVFGQSIRTLAQRLPNASRGIKRLDGPSPWTAPLSKKTSQNGRHPLGLTQLTSASA